MSIYRSTLRATHRAVLQVGGPGGLSRANCSEQLRSTSVDANRSPTNATTPTAKMATDWLQVSHRNDNGGVLAMKWITKRTPHCARGDALRGRPCCSPPTPQLVTRGSPFDCVGTDDRLRLALPVFGSLHWESPVRDRLPNRRERYNSIPHDRVPQRHRRGR